MTLPGQTLKRHIENGDVSAVISLLKAGSINLDERDNVCICTMDTSHKSKTVRSFTLVCFPSEWLKDLQST